MMLVFLVVIVYILFTLLGGFFFKAIFMFSSDYAKRKEISSTP